LLAGQAVDDADPDARKEALALRAALQRIAAREEQTAQAHSDAAGRSATRLLDRLRREGLLAKPEAEMPVLKSALAPTPAPPPVRRPEPRKFSLAWPWPLWGGVATAFALTGWLVLRPAPPQPLEGGEDDVPVLRGAVTELTLQRADPEAFAKQLQADLAAVGAALRPYRTRQDWVLDIDVPPENLDAATPVLQAAGVPARAGLTRLRVQTQAQAQRP
jgi:hypothetical protein